ncbi:acyl-CoA dehydrogenase [Moraxella macacae 0408225]|uniref:3-methylmercaptopropionyl-CoA dehydrogenase n=1 Tax=Moraxella macacae 0408225 TaxID=1230338 RepID=L2F6B2_9GAMM|nr:acyl-CoA dehydrogenase C-terminal domain-containing protein [Moraxella macacae]ELA08557.1 acyl-CoA dehydrogenase [Moraxella macacae 0408225]
MIYHAPIREMQFILNDVFDAKQFWQNNEQLSHLDTDTVGMILQEMSKFSKNVLLPLNRTGDEEGAMYLGDGKVATPKGFKDAFKQYADGGWIGLGGDLAFGGQGMPKMVTMLSDEMLFSTNQSFALYPNLSSGACLCLLANGSDEQKKTYLEKIYSGEWTGTMCLTEPHAGTDLGIIKTKATPNDDGSFNITGTKIFITAGEHDLSDNIIHLVLAKTPNAPDDSKGISLFVVPKFLVKPDGSLGERNAVQAGSIEHKMGIKASATCVMNFDGAKGWLVGAENTGLAGMFVMMNYERLTMGLQGLGAAELAYQNAAAYANERTQGRADSGIKNANKSADSIIHHADVRRMLLNAKVISEASRCFAMYVAKQLDTAKFSDNSETAKQASERVALLTPIAKAFLTDRGFEASIDCQQVFGGHGYIREWGMEQIVRDTRISQIYEGTNGIQALDLLGRKVVKNRGAFVTDFVNEIKNFCDNMATDHAIKTAMLTSADKLLDLTTSVLNNLDKKDEINANAVDYLQAFGYVSFAYMWGLMVEASAKKGGQFANDKANLANFYISRMLPRLDSHIAMVKATSTPMMAFDASFFASSE